MLSATLILLSAFSAQTNDADAFLKELGKSREGVETFRARFIQEVNSPDDTFRVAGTLVYRKPRRLVYRSEEMVTIVDGGTSYEYEMDLEQVLVDDIAGTPLEDLFFFGFEADTERLRGRYDLRLFEEPGDKIGRRRLSIRPKPEDKEASPFLEVIVGFRDEDLLPHNIRVQNDEDAYTSYILNTYELNCPLNDSEIEMVLPPGTIIVERGEVVEEVGEEGLRLPREPLSPDPTLPSRLIEATTPAAE